jgi:DNA replication initiation complex subunit (GINS family)
MTMQTKTKTYDAPTRTNSSPVYDLLLTDSLCNENSRLTDEEKELYEALCNNDIKTMWGETIRQCIETIGQTGDYEMFRKLVKSLQQQADEVPEAIESIIGADSLSALRKVSSQSYSS